jgi:hypothetical protein
MQPARSGSTMAVRITSQPRVDLSSVAVDMALSSRSDLTDKRELETERDMGVPDEELVKPIRPYDAHFRLRGPFARRIVKRWPTVR